VNNIGGAENTPGGQARCRRAVVAILGLAFGLRLLFLVVFPWTLSLETSGYDSYAVHMLEGRGYTRFDDRSADTDLPPLYPFFLAAVYATFGRGALQVALVQAVLDMLTVWLLFQIGRRIAGPGVGLLGAALYGFYPYLFFQNLSANDTGIFILLLSSGIWSSYITFDRGTRPPALLAGVAFGLAALTKPWALLLLPPLFAWWLRRQTGRAGLHLVAAALVSACAVITPWVVRNSLVQGDLVFVSTNDGSNFLQGNNSCVAEYLRRGWDAQWVECLPTPPPGMSELELNRWYWQQGLDYLKQNPGDWPRLLGMKFRTLWNPEILPSSLPPGAASSADPVQLYNTPLFNLSRRVDVIYFTPLLVLGGVGLFLALKRGMDILPLAAVFLVVTLTYLVFHPSTRYRSPADPFLFILAAIPIVEFWRQLDQRNQKK
jgi:4-amino-4-deoxy-L-arabinose transferase-like glycosyltransferase